jgi:hypothetical protein
VIVRAAVVPCPPLLVPELVTGALAETEPVRTACLAAATALAQVSDEWIVVAADPAGPAWLGPDARGTLAGYGVDVPVALSAGADGSPDPELALPALIAGWLRGQVAAGPVRVALLAPGLSAAEYARFGAQLAAGSGPRTGLLVLGDGSNRHGLKSPGSQDERAPGFDAAVAAALAAVDTSALLGLDASLAAELNAGGVPAWQALAGAAEHRSWRATQYFSGAPFGVGYHVAVWDPRYADSP